MERILSNGDGSEPDQILSIVDNAVNKAVIARNMEDPSRKGRVMDEAREAILELGEVLANLSEDKVDEIVKRLNGTS